MADAFLEHDTWFNGLVGTTLGVALIGVGLNIAFFASTWLSGKVAKTTFGLGVIACMGYALTGVAMFQDITYDVRQGWLTVTLPGGVARVWTFLGDVPSYTHGYLYIWWITPAVFLMAQVCQVMMAYSPSGRYGNASKCDKTKGPIPHGLRVFFSSAIGGLTEQTTSLDGSLFTAPTLVRLAVFDATLIGLVLLWVGSFMETNYQWLWFAMAGVSFIAGLAVLWIVAGNKWYTGKAAGLAAVIEYFLFLAFFVCGPSGAAWYGTWGEIWAYFIVTVLSVAMSVLLGFLELPPGEVFGLQLINEVRAAQAKVADAQPLCSPNSYPLAAAAPTLKQRSHHHASRA